MNNDSPIMVVDDDDIDVMAVKRTLNDLSIANPLVRAADGEEALSYLQSPDSLPPGLILLDLNMPRMDGFEFLELIKNDQGLKSLPTVVLTTSAADRDVRRSFELGAAGYMLKPVNYDDFRNIMSTVYSYWSFSKSPK